MAPSVVLTMFATPGFPLPAWVSEGQLMVELAPSFQSDGAALVRNTVKLLVVPERWETVMLVLGSVAFGLSAAIAGSFHLVMLRWKILAIVLAESCRFFTSGRLYEIVMGATTVGM